MPWTRSGLVKTQEENFYVKDVPPGGYKVVPTKKTKRKKDIQSNKIENDYFEILFDKDKGEIVSWVEKKTGREWLDAKQEHKFGQYLNERFTYEQTLQYVKAYQQVENGYHEGLYKPKMISEKEVPYQRSFPKFDHLRIIDDGYTQIAELTREANPQGHLPASVFRLILYKDQPYVDVEMEIKDKQKDNWPEADWLCLPFDVQNPEFNVYRQLGVMNPATDIQSGANRHLYAADYGVTITDAHTGGGVAICALDHPMVSLGTPGCWKWSDNYVPKDPVVYVNLYNNQWNTNFRYWYTGDWSSRIRIWTIAEGTTAQERNRFFMLNALQTRNPLESISVGKNNGTLPGVMSGIEVSRPGIVVTAFGKDPNGNAGTLLRLWEQAGMGGKIIVTLPKGMNASMALPVSLRGEKEGNPISIVAGKFECDLGAYAPASFLLK